METKLNPKNASTWSREIRASFKKVVAFDLLFFAITGAGIVGLILLTK